jgi:nucleotide-binding universal stress UspA family protein
MLTARTILHPTDFSERSQHALGLGCALARDYGARLIILHVANVPTLGYGADGGVPAMLPPAPQELRAAAQGQLDRLQLPPANVRAERRLEQGDAVAEILRVAQEVHADLIVMGTHGRTGLGRLLMGSVAEQVVRQATCPVLTLKTPPRRPSPQPRRGQRWPGPEALEKSAAKGGAALGRRLSRKGTSA